MLAYNLSPSFNWDTTGMTDDEMRAFPAEIGKMGFVFNFMTYGGHQIDGVAAEEFATALRQDGMLALARLQRKMRLVESPYRTPQTLVGGPRSDAALAASSGRTATTKSMGKGSTQHQHLVQTEVPKKLLEEWLALWSEQYDLGEKLRVQFRPLRAGGEVLELGIYGDRDGGEEKLANVLVDPIKDRNGRSILTVRDQNTFGEQLRKKRLMTLIHLWLINRFKADAVYYVTPTEDNVYQTEKMKSHGIFRDVHQDVGEIVVADVNQRSHRGTSGAGSGGAGSADPQGGLAPAHIHGNFLASAWPQLRSRGDGGAMSALANTSGRSRARAVRHPLVDRPRMALATVLALACASSLVLLADVHVGPAWVHWLGSLVALAAGLGVVVVAERNWQRAISTAAADGLVVQSTDEPRVRGES